MGKGALNFLFLNKKGLSAVIVTLILVLLSIVLVGVVWAVINNVINLGSQQVASTSKCLNSQLEAISFSCTSTGSQCNVTIKRISGTEDIGGIRIIFSNENKDSNVTDFSGNIITLATKKVTATNLGVSNITRVSAAIYFDRSSGNPAACSITSNELVGNLDPSGGTSAGGGSTGGGGEGTVTLTCTPDPIDPTINGLCTSQGYACGTVNNGTCGLVSCGTCSSGYYCDTSSGSSTYNTCVVQGQCFPADPSDLTSLCTVGGTTYQCGTVNNGTGCGYPDVTCGTCGTDQFCDLSTHTCKPVSQCVPAPSDFCTSHGYQCGTFTNGTCSGIIDCGDSNYASNGGCAIPTFCNSTYQCQEPVILNSGTITSVYPINAARFFEGSNLPTSQNEDNVFNQGTSYVRFPGSNEVDSNGNTNCLLISYVQYQSDKGRSFVSLSLPIGTAARINVTDQYDIWSTQNGCLYASGSI